MANELIINVTAGQTRVAFLENGVLSEFLLERNADAGIAGNIYLGKVQRVLPGMNAAFVEIGEEKAAFLYASDFSKELKDLSDKFEEDDADEDVSVKDSNDTTDSQATLAAENTPIPSEDLRINYQWGGRTPIHQLLRAGQSILVQVSRAPISTKGARITSHISLPGRFLVYMPTWGKIGVSKKIESFEERKRLRQILKRNRFFQGGFIVRTAAEGATEEQLVQDVRFLVNLWQEILKRKETSPAPALIQSELDVAQRAVREFYGSQIDRILVDDPKEYEKMKSFIDHLMPDLAGALKLYKEAEPIFDVLGIESEINRALRKKVWLKSGGYLVFDQTEALTTIDVNTGRFTGKKDLEETILKNNLEAVSEIVYQLKIRNIGGIIILDLIDMERRANREIVYEALKEALKMDRAKTSLTKISDLGLIEMTRKRSRESLKGLLTEECACCQGRGYLKSAQTVAYEVLRELKREAFSHASSSKKITVQLHPLVLDLLLKSEQTALSKLEKTIGKTIELKSKESNAIEKFDFHASGD